MFFENFLRVLFVWVEANLQIYCPQLSFLVTLSAPELLVELSAAFLSSLIGVQVLIREFTIIKESASIFLSCRRIFCLSLTSNTGHCSAHYVPHYLVAFIGNLSHRLVVDDLGHLTIDDSLGLKLQRLCDAHYSFDRPQSKVMANIVSFLQHHRRGVLHTDELLR